LGGPGAAAPSGYATASDMVYNTIKNRKVTGHQWVN
jgi:hypothetical protein